MSSSFDDGPGPEAPREPAHTPTARAVAVLVAFVVVLVLTLGLVHPSKTSTSTSSSTASTTTATTVAPTTTTTVPPSKVPVLVANGSGVQGQAATVSRQLSAGGWDVIPPVNATATVATTGVYFVAGQSAAADAVAAALHLSPSVVAPFTTSVPVASAAGADVVVVIGKNGVPTSSTATAAATGSTVS